MSPEAMAPFGAALAAYHAGDHSAVLLLRRDDGLDVPLPMTLFFRAPDEFSEIERTALDRCTGRVLDAGAGSGLHTLALQARGLDVVAVDLCPQAVAVMTERGIGTANEADLTDFDDGPFDTLLLLGHGLGMVGDLAGLAAFLDHAHQLVSPDGQLLVHSTDVLKTDDPTHLAYHDTNRQAGRYVGESGLWLEYGTAVGPRYRWLLVEPQVLRDHAARAGWDVDVLVEEPTGEYLACLRHAGERVGPA